MDKSTAIPPCSRRALAMRPCCRIRWAWTHQVSTARHHKNHTRSRIKKLTIRTSISGLAVVAASVEDDSAFEAVEVGSRCKARQLSLRQHLPRLSTRPVDRKRCAKVGLTLVTTRDLRHRCQRRQPWHRLHSLKKATSTVLSGSANTTTGRAQGQGTVVTDTAEESRLRSTRAKSLAAGARRKSVDAGRDVSARTNTMTMMMSSPAAKLVPGTSRAMRNTPVAIATRRMKSIDRRSGTARAVARGASVDIVQGRRRRMPA